MTNDPNENPTLLTGVSARAVFEKHSKTMYQKVDISLCRPLLNLVSYAKLVVLTRALSHPHSPLLRLLEQQSEILNKNLLSTSLQVKAEKRPYRPNHKLTAAEIEQVVGDYHAGQSPRELSRNYGTTVYTQHTIAL